MNNCAKKKVNKKRNQLLCEFWKAQKLVISNKTNKN